MKFRYKVLTINLILLSLSLGVVGYLMIHRNFELAQDTQVQNAVVENNLLQSLVEYELLQILNNSKYDIKEELTDIGSRVADGMNAAESSFYIKYGESYAFTSDGKEKEISEDIFTDLIEGKKNYVISRELRKYYIYVSSYNKVDNVPLYVINKYDVSKAYELMENQIGYFRFLLIVVLLFASVIMYLISMYLTNPLERLNRVTDEIAQENYNTRANVKSSDEIGLLADKFNRMAEAVENHVGELNDMVHRRDQFVADFTHEIKTPMTTIIGYADTLRSREIPRKEEIKALNYIFSEGKRLEQMSGKLFDLIYLKHNNVEMTPLHTENLGNEIRNIVLPALEQKEIKLFCEFEPTLILGNQELLVSVFVNIIDNARKASDQGMEISFIGRKIEWKGTQKEEHGGKQNQEILLKYEFDVIDHGIGMKEEDVKNICDEFYMADKSRSRKEGGAGLGMSIVKMILEKHNARLDVESEINVGTKMKIIFPEVVEEETK